MAKQKNPKRVAAARKNPWNQYIKNKCSVRYQSDKKKVGSNKHLPKKRRLAADVKPSHKPGDLRKKLRAMVVRKGTRTRKRKVFFDER